MSSIIEEFESLSLIFANCKIEIKYDKNCPPPFVRNLYKEIKNSLGNDAITDNPIILPTNDFFKKHIIEDINNSNLGNDKWQYLKKINELRDTDFCLVIFASVEDPELLKILMMHMEYIAACNGNQEKANEEIIQSLNLQNKLFGDLLNNFQVVSYNSDPKTTQRKIYIGEADKSKRVCRFCKKKSPEVAFKQIAHAIPENLGNNRLILNEECDSCNAYFGANIESDFLYLSAILTAFYHIPGKKRTERTFDYEKGSIKLSRVNPDELSLVIEIFPPDDDSTQEVTEQPPSKIDLGKNKKPINPANIYKLFTKIFISLIPADKFQEIAPYLNKTIKWIKDDYSPALESLPDIIRIDTFPNLVYRTPYSHMVLYIRNDDNINLPYLVGEFSYCGSIFVFTVPFSQKEGNNTLKDSLFLSLCKHYQNTDFYTQSYSIDKDLYFPNVINLKQNLSETPSTVPNTAPI